MTDNNPAGAGAGTGDINNAGNPAGGTDPKLNVKPQGNNGFDPSKIGDEDFKKIFDDPRLFRHDRFHDLLERAKEGDKAKEDRKKAEEAQLISQKKFEELAQNRLNEVDEWKGKYSSLLLGNQILSAALKLNVSPANADALLKLVDRSKIKLDENGNASGVEDAVKATLEAYPVFKGQGGTTSTLGGGTNPGGASTGTIKRFKLSQIQDPTFYRDNEKDILAAYKAGAIEDDVHKG